MKIQLTRQIIFASQTGCSVIAAKLKINKKRCNFTVYSKCFKRNNLNFFQQCLGNLLFSTYVVVPVKLWLLYWYVRAINSPNCTGKSVNTKTPNGSPDVSRPVNECLRRHLYSIYNTNKVVMYSTFRNAETKSNSPSKKSVICLPKIKLPETFRCGR